MPVFCKRGDSMLELIGVSKEYKVKRRGGRPKKIEAVDDVSLTFQKGESYAIVGESGSGKSTLAKLIMGLEKPSKGQILYDGQELTHVKGKELHKLRRAFKLVFQNSGGALNPRWKIGACIAEPLVNRHELSQKQIQEKVKKYLELVHLPQKTIEKLPHELSGGEQTRACIARALITEPKVLILDESVSGLDTTVKKQVLDLLRMIRQQRQYTCLFITHDMEAAIYIADNIVVMKNGKVVESAEHIQSLDTLQADYSRQLVHSLPNIKKIVPE